MFRQEFDRVTIFRGLSEEQINLLAPMFEPWSFEKDQVIFEQGQPAEYLYLLNEGEVAIRYKPYDGPPLIVTRIQPGGVFGWSAALGRQEYTSGVIAIANSHGFRMRGQDLHCLCESYPETGTMILDRLASVIAERLRNTHTQILTILSQSIDANGECSGRS
jgi:CRP-like cAMP-binding protein